MKKKDDVDVIHDEDVIPDEQEIQEIQEKFDKESRTRNFSNKQIALVVSIVAVLYSLFHLYMV
ncbi:MAG TPA: hypothetical protein H9885_01155, partial [Candidatus Jeotgalicoccus stercoravium]|nr:hypothetical protein [Candidatus Jeotgalicoccus stercoravium]